MKALLYDELGRIEKHEIEVNTVEDLLAIISETKRSLILSWGNSEFGGWHSPNTFVPDDCLDISIYNNWIE